MSSSTPTGHRVLCYNCSRQYARSEGGLECPYCGSDFVEVLEQPPSPPQHPPPPLDEQEEQQEPAYTPPFSHRYIPRYYNSAAAQPAQPAQPAYYTPPPAWQSVNQFPLPTQLFSHIDGFPNLRVNSRQFVVGNGTNLRFTTLSTPIPAPPHAAPQQSTATPPTSTSPDQQRHEDQPRAHAQDETPEEPNFLRSALNAVAHMLNPEGAAAYERDVERPQQERERDQRESLQQQQGEASHEPSPAQPARSSSEPPVAATFAFGQHTHAAGAPRVTIFTRPLLNPRDANSPQAATPIVHDFEELVCPPVDSIPTSTSDSSIVIYLPELIPVRFLQRVTANANEYFTPPPGPPPGRTPVPGDGSADHAHDAAQQEGQEDTQRRLSTPPEDVPPEAMAPLQAILNLMGAVGFNTQFVNVPVGDAVFTEEALQNIMQQLAEQSGPSGPLPASEEAINALPKKPIDTSMLDDEGKAECTICMENVEVGTEVTVLPCKHWFHTECITLWLKEHDSCPHCRKSIMTDEQREAARERQRERQRVERTFGRPSARRQQAREQVRQQTRPLAQQQARMRVFSQPSAAEVGNQTRGESSERRGSAGLEDPSAEQPAQNQEGQVTGRPQEGPQQQQQQQENSDATLANGGRAWFFQTTVPIMRNLTALNWPGLTRVFGIGTSEPTSPATTSSADTPRVSAGSHTHQPTPTQYPSAAAHTLRTYTPSTTDASAPPSPFGSRVSSDRRAQLEQQQLQSRTLQREQDQQRRQAEPDRERDIGGRGVTEPDRDRDIGGRGVTQDFADWVRRFGGMDPD